MTTQTMAVNSESDLILARLRARELASSLGMNLADQARVCLAVSFVSKMLGLGVTGRGQVTLGDCCSGHRVGLRAVCSGKDGLHKFEPGYASEARWMVDELRVESLPPDSWQITIVKWRE
jgi:hypothetical protein